MIISRTPFRISFLGGGTDYPGWYREHGGAVLATTIDKYCYLNCRYLPPFFDYRYRVMYSKVENADSIDQISHPAVREILRFQNVNRGVEIHHDGDLPARSGMGSSSSFTVGDPRAARLARPHDEQAPIGHGEHPHRAGSAEGDGRFAGPGDGGLRRLEPRPLFPQRRDFRAADHYAAGPHGRIQFALHAFLHRHQADGLGRRQHVRTRHRRTIAAGCGSCWTWSRKGFPSCRATMDWSALESCCTKAGSVKCGLSNIVSNSHVDEMYEEAAPLALSAANCSAPAAAASSACSSPQPGKRRSSSGYRVCCTSPSSLNSAAARSSSTIRRPTIRTRSRRGNNRIEPFRESTDARPRMDSDAESPNGGEGSRNVECLLAGHPR